MIDAILRAAILDLDHPPRVVYSPMIPSAPADVTEDSVVPVFEADHLQPAVVTQWTDTTRSDLSPAIISGLVGVMLSPSATAPLTAGCRIIQVWQDGGYRNASIDIFGEPIVFRPGVPAYQFRVMMTEYRALPGSLIRWDFVPVFPKRRRRRG